MLAYQGGDLFTYMACVHVWTFGCEMAKSQVQSQTRHDGDRDKLGNVGLGYQAMNAMIRFIPRCIAKM